MTALGRTEPFWLHLRKRPLSGYLTQSVGSDTGYHTFLNPDRKPRGHPLVKRCDRGPYISPGDRKPMCEINIFERGKKDAI